MNDVIVGGPRVSSFSQENNSQVRTSRGFRIGLIFILLTDAIVRKYRLHPYHGAQVINIFEHIYPDLNLPTS